MSTFEKVENEANVNITSINKPKLALTNSAMLPFSPNQTAESLSTRNTQYNTGNNLKEICKRCPTQEKYIKLLISFHYLFYYLSYENVN